MYMNLLYTKKYVKIREVFKNLEDYQERARERFEQIKTNYMIDNPIAEFKLKEGIKLQEEYKDIPLKETMRRKEVLRMADELLKTIPLKLKKEIPKNFNIILIIKETGRQANILAEFFKNHILNKQNIYSIKSDNLSTSIKLLSGYELYFTGKINKSIRSLKVHQRFDLTDIKSDNI